MDKATLTSLRRRIGRLTKEQVRPLFEDVMKQREARQDCPDCHYTSGANWHRCQEYEDLCSAHHGPTTLFFIKQLKEHQEQCPNCYITSYWREFESFCEKCEELNDLFYLYARRLTHIQHKEDVRCFEQVHGRPPQNPLELVLWLDDLPASVK